MLMGWVRFVLVAVLLFWSVVVPILLVERIANNTMTSFVWFCGAMMLVGIFTLAMLLLR